MADATPRGEDGTIAPGASIGDVTSADPADRAWARITRLFLSHQGRRDAIAAELGLSATDLITLFHIQPSGEVTQRDLAEHWSCDPSWVTARIDRLEHLGLVERHPSDHDRRVKLVCLTPAGEDRRLAGMSEFNRAPEDLRALSPADVFELARILDQLDLADPTVIGGRHPCGSERTETA